MDNARWCNTPVGFSVTVWVTVDLAGVVVAVCKFFIFNGDGGIDSLLENFLYYMIHRSPIVASRNILPS